MHKLLFLLTLCISALLVSCTGAPAPTPLASDPAPSPAASTAAASTDDCSDAPGAVSGAIVFGADNTLRAVDPDSGVVQALTTAQGETYHTEPAWSPDGQTLAYTLARPKPGSAIAWLPVGMICGMDRATGQGRVLARGVNELDGLSEAAWSPDGSALFVTLRSPKIDDANNYAGETLAIARVDLATGAIVPLVTDAYSPSIAPDGQQLLYLQYNVDDLTTQFMTADLDGQNAQPLVDDPAFGFALTPRWSPNGQQILFTGSSAAQGAAPDRSLVERLLDIRIASAHGPPTDLWLLTMADRSMRRVTEIGLDDTRAAWSPDGTQIAFTHGYGGVFVLDLATNQSRQLTGEGNFGGISWAR